MRKVMNLLMKKAIKSSEQTNGPSHEHSHNLLEPNEHRNESSVSDKQRNKSCKLSVEKIQVQKEAFIEIQSYESVSSDSDNLHKRFDEFCQSMSEKDDTWLFWRQFITMSVLPFLGLYMSMWSENWDLRLASLKLMAPIFHAFHCSNYIKIIPNHLAKIKCLPSSLLDHFENGRFVASIRGNTWSSVVVLDESHEMCINKDVKAAISRLSDDYL